MSEGKLLYLAYTHARVPGWGGGWFEKVLTVVSSNPTTKQCLGAFQASLVAQMVKKLPAMQETGVRSLGWEDPLEEGTATHSSLLAWRIPWTEEPGGLQSIGSQRVRHD